MKLKIILVTIKIFWIYYLGVFNNSSELFYFKIQY